MLKALVLASAEDVERSKQICKELANPEISPKEGNELMAELEHLTGKTLRQIIDEVLNDLNNLGPLFRGHLLKVFNEPYEVEIENKEKIDRWGWLMTTIDGKKVMHDPITEEPEYRPIPKIMVERWRKVYLCETNRKAISKIEELLKTFLEKCRGEFKHISIDRILEAKRAVEYEIAKTDWSLMKKENLSEREFQDSGYIKRRN